MDHKCQSRQTIVCPPTPRQVTLITSLPMESLERNKHITEIKQLLLVTSSTTWCAETFIQMPWPFLQCPQPWSSLSVTGYQRLHGGLIPVAFLELSEADKWNTVCLSQCGYCFLHCNAAQVLQARKEMPWQKCDKGTHERKHAMESWGEEVRQRTPWPLRVLLGPWHSPKTAYL